MAKKGFEQRDDSGSLFKNQHKEKPSHPDFQGKVKISEELAERALNGEVLQLSAWKKETSSGDTYLSLAVNEPYEGKTSGKKKTSKRDVEEDEDDEDFEEKKSTKKKAVTTKRKRVDDDEDEQDDEDDF